MVVGSDAYCVAWTLRSCALMHLYPMMTPEAPNHGERPWCEGHGVSLRLLGSGYALLYHHGGGLLWRGCAFYL